MEKWFGVEDIFSKAFEKFAQLPNILALEITEEITLNIADYSIIGVIGAKLPGT